MAIVNLHIVLNDFSHPSRVLKETSSLVAFGLVDRVHVIAMHSEGLATRELIDEKRDVWRVPLRTRLWPKGLIVQAVKYVEFGWAAIRYARKRKVTLVNVHHVASLPLGWLIKVLSGARLVYDAHELETETSGLRGVRKAAAKLIERLLIRQADLTIVVGDEIKEWYRNQYAIDNIVTVLNCPRFEKPVRSNVLGATLGIPASTKIVLYQGGLGRGRGIETIVDAFANAGEINWALVVMGYGALEKEIRKTALASPRVFFLPAVPPSEVLAYTASADVGIFLAGNTCLNHLYSLPNKLFEYIMAGLPVIISDLPAMKRIVERYRIGVVVPHLDREFLEDTLQKLDLMCDDTLADRLAKAASELSWEVQERKMEAAYRQHVKFARRSSASPE